MLTQVQVYSMILPCKKEIVERKKRHFLWLFIWLKKRVWVTKEAFITYVSRKYTSRTLLREIGLQVFLSIEGNKHFNIKMVTVCIGKNFFFRISLRYFHRICTTNPRKHIACEHIHRFGCQAHIYCPQNFRMLFFPFK